MRAGPANRDPSEVVVDDVPAVGLIDDCSWRRWRFPSDEEPLAEREGAMGDEKRRVG